MLAVYCVCGIYQDVILCLHTINCWPSLPSLHECTTVCSFMLYVVSGKNNFRYINTFIFAVLPDLAILHRFQDNLLDGNLCY